MGAQPIVTDIAIKAYGLIAKAKEIGSTNAIIADFEIDAPLPDSLGKKAFVVGVERVFGNGIIEPNCMAGSIWPFISSVLHNVVVRSYIDEIKFIATCRWFKPLDQGVAL